uniref:Uncharacterized protein n=1 Tax=Rhizophora mucronata TaxID=61149 RepID=A0A2P2NXG2_RHIMU
MCYSHIIAYQLSSYSRSILVLFALICCKDLLMHLCLI